MAVGSITRLSDEDVKSYYQVENWMYPDDYNAELLENDIAVILVTENIIARPYAVQIKRADKDFTVKDAKVVVIGMGEVTNNF